MEKKTVIMGCLILIAVNVLLSIQPWFYHTRSDIAPVELKLLQTCGCIILTLVVLCFLVFQIFKKPKKA